MIITFAYLYLMFVGVVENRPFDYDDFESNGPESDNKNHELFFGRQTESTRDFDSRTEIKYLGNHGNTKSFKYANTPSERSGDFVEVTKNNRLYISHNNNEEIKQNPVYTNVNPKSYNSEHIVRSVQQKYDVMGAEYYPKQDIFIRKNSANEGPYTVFTTTTENAFINSNFYQTTANSHNNDENSNMRTQSRTDPRKSNVKGSFYPNFQQSSISAHPQIDKYLEKGIEQSRDINFPQFQDETTSMKNKVFYSGEWETKPVDEQRYNNEKKEGLIINTLTRIGDEKGNDHVHELDHTKMDSHTGSEFQSTHQHENLQNERTQSVTIYGYGDKTSNGIFSSKSSDIMSVTVEKVPLIVFYGDNKQTKLFTKETVQKEEDPKTKLPGATPLATFKAGCLKGSVRIFERCIKED